MAGSGGGVVVTAAMAVAAFIAWEAWKRVSRKRREREAVLRFATEAPPREPKRLLLINGAASRRGETTALLERVRVHAERLGGGRERVAVETVHVNDLGLQQCVGCANCIVDREKCPLRNKDGFERFLQERLLKCDGLVIATPVYVGGCTGELKKFLDRLAFAFHRPALVGVPALSIAVAAVWWHQQTAKFVEVATEHVGCLSVGRLALTTGSSKPAERDRAICEATLRLLAHMVMPREEFEPTWGQMWSFALNKVGARWSKFDADYWQPRGWLAPSAAYFFPCKISLPKRLFSLAISTALGSMAPKQPVTAEEHVIRGEEASMAKWAASQQQH